MISCELLASARPIDKATYAEKMVSTYHKVTRCEKCGKFHVWTEVTMAEWGGPYLVRREAAMAGYTQVGPNSYLHKGFRRKKVKAENSDDEN